MASKTTTFNKAPWYVLLLSAYPVVALYAANVTEVPLSDFWRMLLLSIGGGMALLLIFRLILKSWARAGLLTVILVFMVFAYGHVYNTLKVVPVLVPFVRHRLLLPAWGALTCLGLVLVTRPSAQPEKATPILNAVTLVALILPLVQIGINCVRTHQAQAEAPQQGLPGLVMPSDQMPPDIYYIILDSYGNAETLKKYMDFDNTEFLETLRAQGFYVAECSQANYNSTELSFVSSLNMNYLTAFGDAFTPGSTDRSHLSIYIKGNATRYTLSELGYQIVAFETGFYWSQWDDADLYLTPNRRVWKGWNEFEDLLVKTSLLRALYDMNILLQPQAETSPHYERVSYVLDTLKALPSMPGPKFVFVHLIMPHYPFDFGSNGEFIASWSSDSRESYLEGYRRQAIYISKVIPQVTAALIANSSTPPIIIIQGDHGPSYADNRTGRAGILNVYYLPKGAGDLYPGISPVNTFRLIFNTYFGGKFMLLDDVSYYSKISDPFTVTEVPNPCSGK